LVVVGVMEEVADAAAGAFGDLAGAFDGADADVLGGDDCAFAHVFDGSDGVESDEVAYAFTDALGGCACTFGGAFADVASATADVSAGAAALGLDGHLCGRLGRDGLRLGLRCWLGGLRAGAQAGCESDKQERGGQDAQGASHTGSLLYLRCAGRNWRAAEGLWRRVLPGTTSRDAHGVAAADRNLCREAGNKGIQDGRTSGSDQEQMRRDG
jgi:hypothetical protein